MVVPWCSRYFSSPPHIFRPPTYLEPCPSPGERPGNTKTDHLLGHGGVFQGRMGIHGTTVWICKLPNRTPVLIDPVIRAVAKPGIALAWGARGPEFKSRQPDQIPQRLTDCSPPPFRLLESKWSPKRTPGRSCSRACGAHRFFVPRILRSSLLLEKPDKPDKSPLTH